MYVPTKKPTKQQMVDNKLTRYVCLCLKPFLMNTALLLSFCGNSRQITAIQFDNPSFTVSENEAPIIMP